ncbi:MAG: PEP-CTERM sorting domain-containing protein [Phycisphaerales bacterium]
MSMRQMTLMAGVSAVLVLAAHAGASLVFEDNFSGTHASFTNAQTFDSDSANTGNIGGFWTANLVTSTTIGSEGGGGLMLSATCATSDLVARPSTSVTSAAGSTFNFFTQQLTFTGTGVAIGGTATNSYEKVGRFGVMSNSTSAYGALSALYLEMVGNNKVSLKAKTGIASNPGTILVNNIPVTGTITGFELTLDATTYDLTIYTTTGTFDSGNNATFAGNHSLTAAGWGNDGNAGLVLEAQRTSNGAAAVGLTGTMTIGQLTVDAIPEPATLGLLTLGGLLIASRTR